jgi:hypothetical protein
MMGDDGIDWGGVGQVDGDGVPDTAPGQAQDGAYLPRPTVKYPEYPDNPHNHRYTISFTGDKAPMVVVRANSAAEVSAALNELEAWGAYANVGAAHAALRAQGAMGNGLGPVTPVTPMAPAPGIPQPPMAPGAPNVPYPGQPAWQQAGAAPQMQQGYQAQPQQQNSYGSQKAEPQPQPPGWPRVNARTGPGFDTWKLLRDQNKDTLKGKIKWGGNADYWVDPQYATFFQNQGFAVTP